MRRPLRKRRSISIETALKIDDRPMLGCFNSTLFDGIVFDGCTFVMGNNSNVIAGSLTIKTVPLISVILQRIWQVTRSMFMRRTVKWCLPAIRLSSIATDSAALTSLRLIGHQATMMRLRSLLPAMSLKELPAVKLSGSLRRPDIGPAMRRRSLKLIMISMAEKPL